MTDEQKTLEDIKAIIALQQKEKQAQIASIASTLRDLVRLGGSDAALALVLVGAEMAAEE